MFGGIAPTVRLQRDLWHPGDPHWYDYAAWLVYLSHFVVTLAVAIVLWVRRLPGFRRFRALSSPSPSPDSSPTCCTPRSRRGSRASGATCRTPCAIVRAMWLELGLADVAAVFGEKSRYAFPVGALPSLHAAWPFLLLLFFWPRRRPTWRDLLVAYALAMALTLVYTADHFVFDILLGWTYVIVVVLAFRSSPTPTHSFRRTACATAAYADAKSEEDQASMRRPLR